MVMKSVCVLCSALLASFLVPSDASIAPFSRVRKEEPLHDTAPVLQQSSAISTSTAMLQALMRGKGPSITQMVKTAQDKMPLTEAMNRLQGKLPAEVSALVDTGGKKPPHCTYTEDSLTKALNILNNMVLQSWKELDKEIIKCKEFEDRNRGTYDQTMTDLARLAEQISDLERQRAEANENINTKESEFLVVKSTLRKQTVIYMKIKWANTQEMTIRKNDLAVMTFVLDLTKCSASGTSTVAGANSSTQFLLISRQKHHGARICHSEGGELSLRFDDPQLEARMESKMTPRARRALREVLGQVIDTPKQSLLETEEPTAAAATTTTTTTMGLPVPAIPKAAVRERPNAEGFWKICKRDEKVNCGVLHDTMSLEWGKFKDSVDELQHEMDKNEAAFFSLREDLNAQMEIIKIAKGRFMMLLAEVISNLNADQVEQQKKEQQRYELDQQYIKEMAKCKKVIMEITFTNICAVIKVRNEVMLCSDREIIDCDVTSWVPEDCSVMCDDNCPAIFEESDDDDKPYSTNFNPYKCGGWQTLNRDIIVKANEWGIGGQKCEHIALTTTRKCNQNKCPVDCEMSMWSGWSKCTKDCEGGVRGRTRAILTKPLNGGDSCNTAQEEEACNTGSCDRDCTLEEWTEWGFCTMACQVCNNVAPIPGLQQRIRKVLVPTRGEGECPKDNSAERWNERKCNTQCCNDDEICVAKQDLVIAIDGSGSLRESGFKIIRDFAADLIDRYKSKYFGADAVQIGVVQFGQGEVMEDGTISPAEKVIDLTATLTGTAGTSVKEKIKALEWKKGFTNMAQALVLAEKMFLSHGRQKAQSAVMVITDGKPTLLFETNQKVVELKDKHVKLFFAPVTEAKGKEVELMKRWASQPWESHLVHVPGLMPLKADPEVFAQQFIATFCPEAMSPSATLAEEKELGYFLLKEKAICGDVTVGARLSSTEQSVGDCAALVRAFNCGTATEKKSCASFTYGEWYRNGYCYAEYWDIPKEKVKDWMMNRENPDGGANPICTAGWIENSFYDTYVFEVA